MSPSRRPLHAGVALAGVAALAGWVVTLLWVRLPEPASMFAAIGVQVGTLLGGLALLVVQARRQPPRIKWAYRLISVAMAAGALSGLLAMVWYVHTGKSSTANVWLPSDTAYVVVVPLMLAALLLFPTSRLTAGSTVTTLLDGAMAGVGLWLCAYLVWLAPLPSLDATSSSVLVKTLLYPAADAMVLGVAFSVLARAEPAYRNKLIVLTAGIAAWAASDVAFIIQSVAGTYRSQSPVTVVAEVGMLCLVGSVLVPNTGRTWPLPATRALNAVPFLPVAAAWLLVAVRTLQGNVLPPLGRFSAVTLLTVVVARLVGGWTDDTALARRLDRTDRLYRALVTGSSDLVMVVSASGRLLHPAPARTVSGVGGFAGPQWGLLQWVHPDDRAQAAAALQTAGAAAEAKASATVRVRAVDDSWKWAEVSLHNRTDDDAVGGVVVSAHDIDARVRLRDDLRRAATHDVLTGLGNMAAAGAALETASVGGPPVAVVSMDADGFKRVNDAYGYRFGDLVLVQVAARLRHTLAGAHMLSRAGGDGFLAVVDADRGAATAEAAVVAMREPVTVDEVTVTVPLSAGVAVMGPSCSVDQVLRDAELALYAAKAAGKNRWELYAEEMLTASTSAMQAMVALRDALNPNGSATLSVAYQPIVDLTSGQTTGMEALARLTASDGTTIPPDVFIAVAEETSLIQEVGVRMLGMVLADMASWHSAGMCPSMVCVNVSRRQMVPSLLDTVVDMAATAGVPLNRLCLELTESAALAAPEVAVPLLSELRARGVCVALDDFGTGESSLTQLRTMPVDIVKLDREFALRAGSQQGWALLSGVVGLCTSMGFRMVAEGVEQEELASALAAAGCHYVQGYLYARPMPFSDATAWLTAHG